MVQTFVARSIAFQLSEKLDSEIKIGSIYISLKLDVTLKDVSVNDQKGNRIFKAKKLELDIEKIDTKNNILKFAGIKINTPDINLIKYKGDSTFSFKFLTEYFKSNDVKNDTIEADKKEKWNLI